MPEDDAVFWRRILTAEAAMLTSPAVGNRCRITLRLPADLCDLAQDAVRLGMAPTQNAFIEDAIRRRARDVRHALLRRRAQEAVADPEFVADMRETMASFYHADGEAWPQQPDTEQR